MRRRRQALPCALTTALFLRRNPGSCPLLKGLQSAERRHAFLALFASPARLGDPREPGKLGWAKKNPASIRLSRGGASAWAPGYGILEVASRRLFTHFDWPTGAEPAIYGA